MNKQRTTLYIILLSVAVLALVGAIHDQNRTVDANHEAINIIEADMIRHCSVDNGFFVGTTLQIPEEIYHQDWVYVQGIDCRVYDKDDVLLVYEDHSKEMVLIQFPDILDDGHLYYDYETNVSNDWWQPIYISRRNITFVKTVLDDFTTTNESDAWAEI